MEIIISLVAIAIMVALLLNYNSRKSQKGNKTHSSEGGKTFPTTKPNAPKEQ